MTARHTRRRFTTKYKLEILRKADACSKPGEVGALLRREGLYSSLLATWRRQRQEGLTPKKRGRKALAVDPRVKKLERENARLVRKLKQADAIIAFQKNHQVRVDHLLDQKLLPGYPGLPEWSGRQLTGDLRARKKTWSGGGCGLDIGDADRRSRLGK